MPINQRYYVVKNKDEQSITYFEYDKMNGLSITPKKNVKIKDAINVNKMVIINPTFVEKMIDMKLNKRFQLLLQMIMALYESDDDTGEGYGHALNEVNKLREETYNKYFKLMTEEKQELFEKKISILEAELRERLSNILENNYYRDDYGRGAR